MPVRRPSALHVAVRTALLLTLAVGFLVLAIQAGASGAWAVMGAYLLMPVLLVVSLVALHAVDAAAPWRDTAVWTVVTLAALTCAANIALLIV